MTTCGFLCVFLPLAAMVLAVPHCAHAQQQTTVGVSLTLSPIQIIHVDTNGRLHNRTSDHRVISGSPTQVSGFGTSMYDVSVDRIPLQLSSRRLQVSIGLQQATTVAGSIRYAYDDRISFEVEEVLAGFTVTATSTAGHVARAVTDDEGNYVLFLPAGSYEISLRENNMPQHVYVETPIHYMVAKASEINAAPVFVLKVEEKKVEIKRFSSP